MSRKVGSGQFGTVVEGRPGQVRKTIRSVELPPQPNETDTARNARVLEQVRLTGNYFQQEVDSLQNDEEFQGLRCHPNLVCAVAQDDKDHTIDMLRAPGKQLTVLIDAAPERYFANWRTWLLMIYQLVEAVAFLHSHDIVHRDIKTANLVWDATTQHLTLVDMGFACTTTGGQCDDNAGTPGFMAPEVYVVIKREIEIEREEKNAKTGITITIPTPKTIINLKAADMYSLGITLLDTMGGTRLDEDAVVALPPDQHRELLTTEMTQLATEGVPQSILTLIDNLLKPDPTHRKTVAQLQVILDGILRHHGLTPRRFTSDVTVPEEEAKTYVNQGPLCHPHLPCRDGTQIRRQPGRSLDDQVLANPRYVFYQLLEAVQWLHSKGQAHHELITSYIFWDPQTAVLQLLPIPAHHAPDPCKNECLTDDIAALKQLQKDYFKIQPEVTWNTLAEGLEALCRTDSGGTLVTTVARAPSVGLFSHQAQRVLSRGPSAVVTRAPSQSRAPSAAANTIVAKLKELRDTKIPPVLHELMAARKKERELNKRGPFPPSMDEEDRRDAALEVGTAIARMYTSCKANAHTGKVPPGILDSAVASLRANLNIQDKEIDVHLSTTTAFFAEVLLLCWAVVHSQEDMKLLFGEHGDVFDSTSMTVLDKLDRPNELWVDGTVFPGVSRGVAVLLQAVVWRQPKAATKSLDRSYQVELTDLRTLLANLRLTNESTRYHSALVLGEQLRSRWSQGTNIVQQSDIDRMIKDVALVRSEIMKVGLEAARHTARGHDVASAFPLPEETVLALRALKSESERLLLELVPGDDADEATLRKAELALGKWIYLTYTTIAGSKPNELSTSPVVQALRGAYTPGALPTDMINTDIEMLAHKLEKELGVAELPRTRTFFATLAQQCWAAVITASPAIELRFPAPGATIDAAWMLPSASCDTKGPLVDGTAFPAVVVGGHVVQKAVVWVMM